MVRVLRILKILRLMRRVMVRHHNHGAVELTDEVGTHYFSSW